MIWSERMISTNCRNKQRQRVGNVFLERRNGVAHLGSWRASNSFSSNSSTVASNLRANSLREFNNWSQCRRSIDDVRLVARYVPRVELSPSKGHQSALGSHMRHCGVVVLAVEARLRLTGKRPVLKLL